MASTVEGKKISAQNAIKHGILAETQVLPDESHADFDAFSQGLRADLEPQGALQVALFDLMVVKLWRLRRVYRAEFETLSENWVGIMGEQGLGNVVDGSRSQEVLNLCGRYEQTLERGFLKLLNQFRSIQSGSSFGDN